jgi:hypothetical protein
MAAVSPEQRATDIAEPSATAAELCRNMYAGYLVKAIEHVLQSSSSNDRRHVTHQAIAPTPSALQTTA